MATRLATGSSSLSPHPDRASRTAARVQAALEVSSGRGIRSSTSWMLSIPPDLPEEIQVSQRRTPVRRPHIDGADALAAPHSHLSVPVLNQNQSSIAAVFGWPFLLGRHLAGPGRDLLAVSQVVDRPRYTRPIRNGPVRNCPVRIALSELPCPNCPVRTARFEWPDLIGPI